jgi:hypothetical protein
MKNFLILSVIVSIILTTALISFAKTTVRKVASRVEFGSMIEDSLAERKQAAQGLQEKINVEKINVYQKRQAFQINKLEKNPEMVNVSDSHYQANYRREKVEKHIAKHMAKKTSRKEIEKQNSQLEKDIANIEAED